jgi:site-specific recombinase XerC
LARRANGDGSIRRKTDGRWEAAVRIAGRRYWLTGKTQSEVRGKLDALKREHHIGTLVPPQRLTLGDFLDQWIEAGKADWRPKTTHGYTVIVNNYWRPELGHVQLQRLTPSMLASCYARWRQGRSGGTLLNVHRCLHRALVVAVRWGLVPRNVADAVGPPRAHRRKPQLWSPEQAATFLAATREDRWHVLWALLLGTGCRLGEAVGLQWQDVDLDAGTVTIQRALVWAGTTPNENEPKTASGTRVLVLPSFVIDALRAWRDKQGLTAPTDRIVTQANGKSPAPWVCRNAFQRACRQVGLPPMRRHDCRHLAASLLIANGVALPAVAQRLGHASPAITAAIYSHALKDSDQQAARALQSVLAGNRRKGFSLGSDEDHRVVS